MRTSLAPGGFWMLDLIVRNARLAGQSETVDFGCLDGKIKERQGRLDTVSYTHLTLPTKA